MKKVITELTKDSVNIIVEANDVATTIILPVSMIAPQISLQIAGLISSDPTLPRRDEKVSE